LPIMRQAPSRLAVLRTVLSFHPYLLANAAGEIPSGSLSFSRSSVSGEGLVIRPDFLRFQLIKIIGMEFEIGV